MIDILAIVLGLIVTFLTVVIVHELGHFAAARMVGVKPEVFSVGFGRTLWSREDRRGVNWRIAALPIGGYVRFVGDENAASLSTVPDGPPVAGSLRAVSKLRQSIVVIAGPLANVILTVALLSAVPMFKGVTAYPWTIDTVAPLEASTGLQIGDTLRQVGDFAIAPDTPLGAVLAAQGDEATIAYRYIRDGLELEASGPRLDLPMIGMVNPGSPSDRAGLMVGDLITSIDDQPIDRWSDLQAAVAASEGKTLDLSIQRRSQEITLELASELHNGQWLIGVGSAPYYTLQTETPSPVAALGEGFDQSWALLQRTVGGLAMSLFGQGDPCALDGPVAISRVAGQAIQLGPEVFLTFLAVISLGLGLLNLLPIPIFDGGHLLMLVIEGATGKATGKRLQAVLFIAGVTLIVFLMLTATINDLRC